MALHLLSSLLTKRLGVSLIRTVTGRIFANHSVSRICPLIVDNVPSSVRERASSLTLINKTNVPPLKITRTLFNYAMDDYRFSLVAKTVTK